MILKNHRYKIIIFVVDAICMILELVASRIISPYFGNSNIVWTGVIGIILLSTSVGNYIGGKIADKDKKEDSLKITLLVASIFILIIPIIQNNVLEEIIKYFNSEKIGSLIAASVLFFIPSMFMGMVTPIVMKLEMNSLNNVGKVAGKLTAIGTIGGLVGTFLGGFFLIPNIGSVYIVYVLNMCVCLLILLVNEWKGIYVAHVIISILISVALMTTSISANDNNSEKILNGELGVTLDLDTQYGRVLIYNEERGNDKIRVLNIDSGYESASYANEEKANDLVYEYTKYYDLMFEANNEIKDVLLIGGAGYSYPKHFISSNEDKNMDVVEIDGKITEVAKEYFYLNKLIKDYNLENNHRLNLINADGRVYLNNNKKKYDAILNDAFSGNSPAKTLTTKEAIQNIKKSLTPEKGVYLTNIISALEGEDSKFIKAEVNTLKQVFKNVYVIPCTPQSEIKVETRRNNMVIATDKEIEFEKAYDLKLDKNEITITDDYCPVDTLIPR